VSESATARGFQPEPVMTVSAAGPGISKEQMGAPREATFHGY